MQIKANRHTPWERRRLHKVPRWSAAETLARMTWLILSTNERWKTRLSLQAQLAPRGLQPRGGAVGKQPLPSACSFLPRQAPAHPVFVGHALMAVTAGALSIS